MEIEYKNVLQKYNWLFNLYSIDYYVKDNWMKLPDDWRDVVYNLSVNDWISMLDGSVDVPAFLPESLKELRQKVKNLSLDRNPVCFVDSLKELLNADLVYEDFMPVISSNNVLRYKIKRKKQHEIERIIALLRVLSESRNYDFNTILDIGAGLGHLSRMVACFLPDMAIGTIEGNQNFVETSTSLDEHFRKRLGGLFSIPERKFQYLRENDNKSLNPATVPTEFTKKNLFLGLHACGDLSSIIVQSFTEQSNATTLVLFGCCYHKINGGLDNSYRESYQKECENSKGFPLSKRFLDIKISYTARELACHAKEQLLDDLKKNVPMYFKQRCYRALLEWILVKFGEQPHMHIKSVKINEHLKFETFVEKALCNRPELVVRVLSQMEIDEDLKSHIANLEVDGKRQFILHCLRTMIAPIVESIIIKDRVHFIDENGFKANVFPVFNPLLSPRNIVIVAKK